MRSLSICLAACTALTLAACGDDGDGSTPIDAAASIDAPAGALTCAAYCSSITQNCSAGNKQYNDMASCLASCAFMPVGSIADTQGNTLGCRTYHAGTPAMTTPATHCAHAGPGGADPTGPFCGNNCQGFCQIVLGACTGANQQYGGQMATCMTQCSMFNDNVKYAAQQTGNTLACRLYHATVATTAPGMHCGHTAAVSSTCQ